MPLFALVNTAALHTRILPPRSRVIVTPRRARPTPPASVAPPERSKEIPPVSLEP